MQAYLSTSILYSLLHFFSRFVSTLKTSMERNETSIQEFILRLLTSHYHQLGGPVFTLPAQFCVLPLRQDEHTNTSAGRTKPLLRRAPRGLTIKHPPLKRHRQAGKCFKGVCELPVHSRAYTPLLLLRSQRC